MLSEHGEMFAKHGRFGRAGTVRGTLYEDVIHIPLIIKLPESAGKRIAGLTQIIDIMPTILEMLDIPLSLRIQGKSLLPLIGGGANINEYIYAGLPFNQAIAVGPPDYYNIRSINESIRSREWKLIREVQFSDQNKEIFELYNLKSDPIELINIFDKFPETADDLKNKLAEWSKRAKEFKVIQPDTQEVPEDLLRDARKHGYW